MSELTARITDLNSALMKEHRKKEINTVDREMRVLMMALTHYRDALEIEEKFK
jgi:hypothetical protein